MQRLFHIVEASEWSSLGAGDTYRPASLEAEGFVHFSFDHQVAGTLSHVFAGRTGLVVLEVDPALVSAPLVVEDLYGMNEEFPHVYGPVPVAAVIAVHSPDSFDSATPPPPPR